VSMDWSNPQKNPAEFGGVIVCFYEDGRAACRLQPKNLSQLLHVNCKNFSEASPRSWCALRPSLAWQGMDGAC
jgi:hypothetical protein